MTSTVAPTGPTALVTGCSSGIGKALAKELASRGARRLQPMEELKKWGVRIIALDVTDQASVDEAKRVVQEFTGGTLDYLFNNAGQSNTFPVTDINVDDAKAAFDVNVFGVMRMVNAFAPLLIAAKGKIVTTGSVAGVIPFPFGSVYSASKAAIHQYSNVIRLELKPFGVQVITLVTGGVKSSIADTRPLPAGSIFLPVDYGVQARRNMAADNEPTSAEDYAKEVVTKVTKFSPDPFLWVGHMATTFRYVSYFFPRRLLDFLLMRRFKLLDLVAILKDAKAKSS